MLAYQPVRRNQGLRKMGPHLRITRPTNRIEELARMYESGLNLTRIGEFRNHNGFDGIILGAPGLAWHLEFTHEQGVASGGAPSSEQLLVLYYPSPRDWKAICDRMNEAGFIEVPPHNPYWQVKGRTFSDLDGYRVVIQNSAWQA